MLEGVFDRLGLVLTSFREWLHSYVSAIVRTIAVEVASSHLFQRVASFLLKEHFSNNTAEWTMFSSLSESGFIPTMKFLNFSKDVSNVVLISFREWLHSYRTFIGRDVRETWAVLISFREWLHSYKFLNFSKAVSNAWGSHLFQRVASFLRVEQPGKEVVPKRVSSHLFQRVASFLQVIGVTNFQVI